MIITWCNCLKFQVCRNISYFRFSDCLYLRFSNVYYATFPIPSFPNIFPYIFTTVIGHIFLIGLPPAYLQIHARLMSWIINKPDLFSKELRLRCYLVQSHLYDGAGVCELVCMLSISKLGNKFGDDSVGLHRIYGLLIHKVRRDAMLTWQRSSCT